MNPALDILASIRTDIDRHGHIPVAYLRTRLDALERAITGARPQATDGSPVAVAILALAALGTATPIQIGQALDPARNAVRARNIGGVRLGMLKQAGWARNPRHGWWVLTDAGRAEAERLAAGRAAA